MNPALRGLWALALAAACACHSARPTEFVNITFTPSVPTDDYATWDFELASCQDFGDERVDDDFVRAELLAAIEDELTQRGYERRPGEPVHFTVYYRLWVADGGDLLGVAERSRGQIFIRDVKSGRNVWRGERKAPVTGKARTREEQSELLRRFVRELLEYTRKLEAPEDQV